MPIAASGVNALLDQEQLFVPSLAITCVDSMQRDLSSSFWR